MLILAAGATVAITMHGIAKIKKVSEHLLTTYQKMLNDVRETRQAVVEEPEATDAAEAETAGVGPSGGPPVME